MTLHPFVPHAAPTPTPRMAPEQRMLCLLVEWAVREANGVVAGEPVEETRATTIERARDWFRERREDCEDGLGWGYVIQALGLSAEMVRRTEERALGGGWRTRNANWPREGQPAPRRGPLTDAEWERVRPIVATVGNPARNTVSRRTVLDAMLLKAQLGRGVPLPPGYPTWNLVLQCRLRWERNGVWAQLARHLPLD